jgi:hypothetical protein
MWDMTPFKTIEVFKNKCGNGDVEVGEECDGSNFEQCIWGACALDCTCAMGLRHHPVEDEGDDYPECGNGTIDQGEECDPSGSMETIHYVCPDGTNMGHIVTKECTSECKMQYNLLPACPDGEM